VVRPQALTLRVVLQPVPRLQAHKLPVVLLLVPPLRVERPLAQWLPEQPPVQVCPGCRD
jgi:hypothetical protein